MPDAPIAIPEGYEIVKAIGTSDSVAEYIARYQVDDTLVRLRIFNFTPISGFTTRRHIREHLRSDITFMEELEHPGIIHIFDYSDTKTLFWIATQPAEVDKLTECFDFLTSQSFEFRFNLVQQFLAILQRIHNSHVVHRNLSSDAVFLTPKYKIYIGDFGFASYLTDRSTTRLETSLVTATSYLPPEVKNANTFTCNVSCDVFSAGLLVFEILSAIALPKDKPDEIQEILRGRLNEQVADGNISFDTAEAILKAVNLSPEKRWPTVEDFSIALKASKQNKPFHIASSVDHTATIAITESVDQKKISAMKDATEVTQQKFRSVKKTEETADTVTPLDPSHEIWNNHYEIIEKIGEGGQAVVYKAHDHLTNEEVAIKTIWSRHREDRAAINRLKQGAMIARSLTHRRIIKTYSVEQRTDTDSLDRYVFICMELISSKMDLGNVIETRKASGQKFRLDETLHIIRQLLDALTYAHEYTIHRDIKPGNIMLVPHDMQAGADISDLTKFDIKLIDFGIAKVLSQKHIDVTGKGFRSAYYGAPELADARTGVDARADIFSAGVIMYQMLTGNIPRKGSPTVNKVNKAVPAALARIIDQAINTDREKRFKTASEFTNEIERAVSKFNWVRKAAKIAAVLLIGFCAVAVAKHFLPEPDYGSVQQTIEVLKDRNPDLEITEIANNTFIRYSDIEGYDSYDNLRQTALESLKVVEMAGNNKFNKRSFSPWKEQEKVWLEIEPAINEIERIAQDRRKYNARKDLAVAGYLMELNPSSKIVSEVTHKAETAEKLIETRPLSKDTVKVCADSYNLAASVYTNIDEMADNSDTPGAAQQINEKLKDVEKLRNDSLLSRNSLETIQQLQEHDFYERSNKCFEKADRYYQAFELRSATKYFSLLEQICGTMASVQDQIDFGRSDIRLVSSRLMELCYEDIETFENYPSWKEKLERVYRKKDIVAKYALIQSLLTKGPKETPLAIYDLAVSAQQHCQQGNLDSAADELDKAAGQYKKFIQQKIGELILDCKSLSTFATVSVENIEKSKNGLKNLLNSINEFDWPQADLVDKYNHYTIEITKIKDEVRQQLIENARLLRGKIISSKIKAKSQSFFWRSQRINEITTAAQQYDNDDIGTSIENWKFVENLSRLSAIVEQMRDIDSILDNILARKDQLDHLAAGIDEAIDFCQKFKGISSEEKEKYKQWEADLKQLRSKLSTPRNNVYLIDQTNEVFTVEYKDIQSAFSEIRAQLPYHRSRVIEIIKKTHLLESSADNIGELQQHWSEIFADSDLPSVKPDFDSIRAYLERVKEDVDNWPPERFNQQMEDKCNVLAGELQQQNQTLAAIISAVLEEKSNLIQAIESFDKKVNEILSDGDIRTLNEIAANDKSQALLQFRQLPNLLNSTKKKIFNIILDNPAASENIKPASNTSDFEVDSWLLEFNARKGQLDTLITQLQAIGGSVSTFQETRRLLTQQSSIETNYYLGLRDYTLSLIDYSDISNKINTVAADDIVVKMCRFLEQMANDSVPRIEDLKASISEISQELTNLKSAEISSLSEAKNFNRRREQLLDLIATIRQDLGKLDKTKLENICKQTVTNAVEEIENLIDNPNETDRVNELTSTLWAFYPDRRSWHQWDSFLQIFHIVVSNENLWLASSNLLRPVDQKGNYLNLIEVAANPAKAFYIKAGESTNFGWPRYVSHQKDPTMILAFIPVVQSIGPEPFYMATREISNAQYKLFMEKTQAKSTTKLAGWSYFSDQSNNLLIGQAQGQFPSCRIAWDKSTEAFVLDDNYDNDPVTWITYHGAKAYAQWLGAQLPTAQQHAHATLAGSNNLYPWGDELSNAVSYAHVRSAAWQDAARDYNAKRDNPVEIAYPPIGAIKDFLREEALDPSSIVHSLNDNFPVWPCFTSDNKPNAWDLYDMIGNVWEWCTDTENGSTPVICGGSCLCPSDYISPQSKYEFKAQACDVGFRVVIPVK